MSESKRSTLLLYAVIAMCGALFLPYLGLWSNYAEVSEPPPTRKRTNIERTDSKKSEPSRNYKAAPESSLDEIEAMLGRPSATDKENMNRE